MFNLTLTVLTEVGHQVALRLEPMSEESRLNKLFKVAPTVVVCHLEIVIIKFRNHISLIPLM